MVFAGDSSRASEKDFSAATSKSSKVSDTFVPRRHGRPMESTDYEYEQKNKGSSYMDNDREKGSDAESAADEDLSFVTREDGSYDSYDHEEETIEVALSNDTDRSSITSGFLSCGVGTCLDVLGASQSRKGAPRRKKKPAPNPLFLFSRPADGYESLLEHARVTSGQNVFDDEEEDRDDGEKHPTPYERALEKKKDDPLYDRFGNLYDGDSTAFNKNKKFVPEVGAAQINDISTITAPANAPGQDSKLIQPVQTAAHRGIDTAVLTNAATDDIAQATSGTASSSVASVMGAVSSVLSMKASKNDPAIESEVESKKPEQMTKENTVPTTNNGLGPVAQPEIKFTPANPAEAKLHADFLVCVRSIYHRKWDICEELVSSNPAVVSYTFIGHGNQTLLHIMASQRSAVPISFASKILAGNSDGVGTADKDGNLPIHVAATNAASSSILRLILNLFRAGASIKNSNGDLPLHLASTCGVGSEESVQLLLDAYPDAVHMQNNKEQIPLHMVCSNEKASLSAFLSILDVHKKSRADAPVLDIDGDTPLTNAIKNRVPHEFVRAFHDSQRNFVRIFLQPDGRGQLPLHLALQLPGVDPEVVSIIIDAAPFTASVPTTTGHMPIQLATKNGMAREVVKSLLLTDMPLDLGMKEFVGFKNSDLKQHSHSFWHIVVECEDRYIGVVHDIIDLATQPQVIALARSFGPDGKTRLAQAASGNVIEILRMALKLHTRYELLSTKPPFILNDVMTFAAIDQGGNSDVLYKYNKSSLPIPTSIGGTVDGAGYDNVLKSDDDLIDNDDEKEVVLRCYYFKDAFMSEMTNRENYKVDSNYVELIHAAHEKYDSKKYAFCGGKLLAISFEKPDHTLAELYLQTKEKGKKWIRRKATDVLREAARCLEHLHSHGLVHGNINTSNVAKYGLSWKIRGVGGATPIGQPMAGPIKPCMPPEVIAKGDNDSSFSSDSDSELSDAIKSLNDIKDELEASVVEQMMDNPNLTVEDPKMLEDLNNLVSSKNEKRRKRVGFMFFRMDEIGLADKQGWHRHDDVEEKKAVKYIQTHASQVHEDTISKLMGEISRLKLVISQHNKSNKALTEKDKEIKRLQHIVHRNLQKGVDTNEAIQDSEFKLIAHVILANPSWDVWSFGLIMAQLLLGRSVLLPSFEKDEVLLMENLYNFDKEKLEKIRLSVTKVAGNRAGDLISRLLHPDPAKRPASFTMILQHKYFREDLNDALSTASNGSDNETHHSGGTRNSRSARSSRGMMKARDGGGGSSTSASHKKSHRDAERRRESTVEGGDDCSVNTFNY